MTAGMRDKNTFSFAKLSSKVGALCGGFKLSVVGINPLTPKISLVILLSVYHTVLVMLVWRIWDCINL